VRIGAGILLIGLFIGCARVDPQPDYRRVAEVVGARTGYADVYDPSGDAHAAQQVAELLREPLTVQAAVRVALLNNPAFQAQFAALGASRADLVQSALLTNPSVSLGFQFPDGGGRSKLSAGLAQQIADLWQIPVRKKIAATDLERALLATARQGIQLVAEAKTRSYRLLALQRSATMLREGRALAERATQLAEAQVRGGEASQFDLNLARAALLDVDLELLALQRDEQTARLELAHTLGLSRASVEWTLADDWPADAPQLPDDAELIATALLQRLDARAALLEVDSATDEVLRQYARIIPDATLGLDLERPDNRALPGRKLLADTVRSSIGAGQLTAPSIQSRGERRLEKAQVIDALLGPSLTITLPLWDQNQAQIAKARYALAQRRKDLEDLLDTVAGEVQQAAAALRNARDLVRVYRQEALPQAEANVAASLHLYEQGEQSILTVLDAQESLLKRRRSYIEACRDDAVALAALEQALAGRVTPNSGPATAPAPALEDSP